MKHEIFEKMFCLKNHSISFPLSEYILEWCLLPRKTKFIILIIMLLNSCGYSPFEWNTATVIKTDSRVVMLSSISSTFTLARNSTSHRLLLADCMEISSSLSSIWLSWGAIHSDCCCSRLGHRKFFFWCKFLSYWCKKVPSIGLAIHVKSSLLGLT